MTTWYLSEIKNLAVLTGFDPAADALVFDGKLPVSAASVTVSYDPDLLTGISLVAGGKTFYLPDSIGMDELLPEQFQFDDGSTFVFGDARRGDWLTSPTDGPNDQLFGFGGDDELDGGAGADRMVGGRGSDSYHVDNSGDQAVETDADPSVGGVDTVWASASFTLGSNVENLILTGTSAINGVGNDIGNGLTGNDGNNTLEGRGGADVLEGGYGHDLMIGGDGSDTYDVDEWGDQVSETNADAATGGVDTVWSSISYTLGANVEKLYLKAGYLFATDAVGNGLDNTLVGNEQHNMIDGGYGADVMMGGAGSDEYHVDNPLDQVIETDPSATGGGDTVWATINYTLPANVESLFLYGYSELEGTGNELGNGLYGSFGSDRLTGLGGNDFLDGKDGADVMIGGAGSDGYSIDNAGDQVIETDGSSSGGIDSVWSDVDFALDPFFENIFLTGTTAVSAIGNGRNNAVYGNDIDNILIAGGGNDEVSGGLGADRMVGGLGSDLYYVDNAGDKVIEKDATVAGGIDKVVAYVSFTLGANIENLTLEGAGLINGTGNALDNVMRGNNLGNFMSGREGNDTIDGYGGGDTMLGGSGDDTYTVWGSNDRVFETTSTGSTLDAGGTDTVISYGTYSISATIRGRQFVENLTLVGNLAINGTGNDLANRMTGNVGANVLSGGLGNDVLQGRRGDDALNGGDGNDWLQGDANRDIMTGGAGADRFVFRTAADFGGASAATADRIVDLVRTQGDRIHLGLLDADATTAGTDEAFSFIGTEAFTNGVAGQLRYAWINGNTFVQGDTDGDADADFWIRVDGEVNLASGDFIL